MGEIVDSAVSGAVRVVVGKLATAAGLTAINRMITAAGCDSPFRPGSNYRNVPEYAVWEDRGVRVAPTPGRGLIAVFSSQFVHRVCKCGCYSARAILRLIGLCDIAPSLVFAEHAFNEIGPRPAERGKGVVEFVCDQRLH